MTFLEQIQADWLFYALNILGFVVVVLVTWLLVRSKQAKALVALEQQQKDISLVANGVFIGLQEAIDKEREYLRCSVQLLEQALLNGAVETLQEQRHQIIHGLMQKYRPKVASQVQLWQTHYKADKEQQQRLAEQTLVPFLENSRQLIAAVNAKAVLQELPNSLPANKAFVGEEIEFNFAFEALKDCGLKRWAKKYRKALAFEPVPKPA